MYADTEDLLFLAKYSIQKQSNKSNDINNDPYFQGTQYRLELTEAHVCLERNHEKIVSILNHIRVI